LGETLRAYFLYREDDYRPYERRFCLKKGEKEGFGTGVLIEVSRVLSPNLGESANKSEKGGTGYHYSAAHAAICIAPVGNIFTREKK